MSQTEVQLIKDAVIVNADVSNSAAIDVSKISGAMPLAGGTFSNDVTFEGTTSGRNVVFDRSDNAFEFADNATARFGNGDDLQIYHNATNSVLQNATGALLLQSNDLKLGNYNLSDIYFRGQADNAAELYFDNSKKLETTASGVELSGNLNVTGYLLNLGDSSGTTDDRIRLGASADLQLYHDASDSNITNTTGVFYIQNTGDLRLRVNDTEAAVHCVANGAVELYHNGNKKLETNTDGTQIFNTLEIGNTSAPFLVESTTSGNGLEDIGRIGINRTNSSTTDRQMWLQYTVSTSASQAAFQARSANDTGTAGTYLKIDAVNNNVDLPRDNEKLQLGAGNDLQLYHNGTRSEIINNTGDLIIQTSADNKLMLRAQTGESHFIGYHNAQVELYYDGSKKFETISTGITVTGDINITDDLVINTGNAEHVLRDFTSSSDSDIFGLLSGSTFGTLQEVAPNGHHVIALRENDVSDSFAIISGGGNYQSDTTFDTCVTRFKADGKVLFGEFESQGVLGLAAKIQVAGGTAGDSSIALRRFGDSAQGAFLTFSKSRNASDASRTVVQDGDELGRISFCMDDGTDLAHAGAEIRANVDTSPGVNDTPGRISFLTTQDGANALTERFRINNIGNLHWRNNNVKQRKIYFFLSQSGDTQLDTKLSENFSNNDMLRVDYSYNWNAGDGGAWGTAVVWKQFDGVLRYRLLGEETSSPAELIAFFASGDDVFIRFDLVATSGMNGYAMLNVEAGGCDPRAF